MSEPKAYPLERSITGFAYTLSAIGAILLLPFLARHVRTDICFYVSTGLDYSWASWISWIIVILLALSAFFGGSALLQALIQKLFRRGSHVRSPF